MALTVLICLHGAIKLYYHNIQIEMWGEVVSVCYKAETPTNTTLLISFRLVHFRGKELFYYVTTELALK